MVNIWVPSILREVKVFVTKYYRHPYIHKLNSADKEQKYLNVGVLEEILKFFSKFAG